MSGTMPIKRFRTMTASQICSSWKPLPQVWLAQWLPTLAWSVCLALPSVPLDARKGVWYNHMLKTADKDSMRARLWTFGEMVLPSNMLIKTIFRRQFMTLASSRANFLLEIRRSITRFMVLAVKLACYSRIPWIYFFIRLNKRYRSL